MDGKCLKTTGTPFRCSDDNCREVLGFERADEDGDIFLHLEAMRGFGPEAYYAACIFGPALIICWQCGAETAWHGDPGGGIDDDAD